MQISTSHQQEGNKDPELGPWGSRSCKRLPLVCCILLLGFHVAFLCERLGCRLFGVFLLTVDEDVIVCAIHIFLHIFILHLSFHLPVYLFVFTHTRSHPHAWTVNVHKQAHTHFSYSLLFVFCFCENRSREVLLWISHSNRLLECVLSLWST